MGQEGMGHLEGAQRHSSCSELFNFFLAYSLVSLNLDLSPLPLEDPLGIPWDDWFFCPSQVAGKAGRNYGFELKKINFFGNNC